MTRRTHISRTQDTTRAASTPRAAAFQILCTTENYRSFDNSYLQVCDIPLVVGRDYQRIFAAGTVSFLHSDEGPNPNGGWDFGVHLTVTSPAFGTAELKPGTYVRSGSGATTTSAVDLSIGTYTVTLTIGWGYRDFAAGSASMQGASLQVICGQYVPEVHCSPYISTGG